MSESLYDLTLVHFAEILFLVLFIKTCVSDILAVHHPGLTYDIISLITKAVQDFLQLVVSIAPSCFARSLFTNHTAVGHCYECVDRFDRCTTVWCASPSAIDFSNRNGRVRTQVL